jgi:hypothetical protein
MNKHVKSHYVIQYHYIIHDFHDRISFGHLGSRTYHDFYLTIFLLTWTLEKHQRIRSLVLSLPKEQDEQQDVCLPSAIKHSFPEGAYCRAGKSSLW